MPQRYRAFVLLKTFANLRWGEITALQRMDLDVDRATVRIRQQYIERRGVGLELGPPKSRAGIRSVSFPKATGPVIRAHLDTFVDPLPTALVFPGPTGVPLWRGNFNKLVGWKKAAAAIGVPDLHLHDLRHTGNTLASQTGPASATSWHGWGTTPRPLLWCTSTPHARRTKQLPTRCRPGCRTLAGP